MKEDYSIWDVEQELRPTKMAVIEVGKICNSKCKICYHRYTTFDAPKEKRDIKNKSFEDIKCELDQAKERHCNYCDFTGGEPLLHKDIIDIIKYSKSLGIEPRIITNGQHELTKFDEVIEAGCIEFLFSFHNLGKDHDDMTQVKGSYERMLKSLNHIIDKGCKYSTNTVIYKDNYDKLPEIMIEILNQKKLPTHINIINCNPQYEPDNELAHRNISAEVTDSKLYIEKAIKIATQKNVWINIRYFPMCVLEPIYRKHIVNFPQVFFDWRNEWDYGHPDKTVASYLDEAYKGFIEPASHNTGKCLHCGIKGVCGGINSKYVDCFGERELKPQDIKSNNPNYYRSEQEHTTIIIPCYNPDKNLSRLLTEIQAKTQPPYNLVLVRGQRSASLNRNEGLDSVSKNSAFIIQIDDDICELPMFWNKRLTDRLLYDPELMSVSARLMTPKGLPAMNSADNFNIDSDYEIVNLIPTACMVVRASDIRLHGLKFEELMVASGWEDTLFIEQLKHLNKQKGLGTKIMIDNNCKVVHINNASGQSKWNDYNKQIYLKKKPKV
jgi:MoaA/NifB/PqqE/SkfB family radical SAM enzyme